ncbi:MAG: peptidoglycan DD-metalloendopeptidase family protein [Spirochaetaceae bacterium]|nr:peptidoglycan DD-metalloendopeptidase family protein [Spirochaetaceae bacterium]
MRKSDIKNGLICAGLTFCSCVVVAGIVCVAVVQKRKSLGEGQGGFETPGIVYSTEAALENMESIENGESLTEMLESEETTHVAADGVTYLSYRVKAGDMIGKIAERYGVTEDTLLSVNNIQNSRTLQINQYLRIPSMAGILYTVGKNGETIKDISEKYEINADDCAYVNKVALESTLSAGASLFLPGARMDYTTRQEINGDLFVKPLHSYYYLSSYYGYRTSPFDSSRRTFHGGIDMAAYQGTAIYAALSGTVTETGYSSVYGNYVIISHHSGYKTLYGHMSKILAHKGQVVNTSTQIGKVGSTGMSTGPHLHFTVYKNGKTVNPLGLIK